MVNSGPVVAADQVEDLFEPFRRLCPDRVDSARGVGLGLSIVRSVARAHGGDVRAHTRAEGGLDVTVTLPATSPLTAPPTPAPPAQALALEPVPGP